MKNFTTCQLNRDYSAPPESEDDAPEMTTEQLCDHCAEQWVIDGGDVELLLGSTEAIANRIEFGNEGATLIDYMAARWVENGGDADGWRRCAGEIRFWIVPHMAARGLLKN